MRSRIDLKGLALRESEQVEWKENVADVDDVVATLCAFANDLSNLGGGYVVCGAREAKDAHGFPILELPGLTAARLKEVEGTVLTRCREKVSPPIVPLVEEVSAAEPDRRVLVFTIAATTDLHLFRRANEGGKYFVRISRETREARNGILRDLLVRKGGAEPWDRRPCVQATENDIDLLALREGLQRLGLHRGGNGGVEAYLSATLPLNSFVPPLLVREPLTGTLRPRNFALLLFGHNVQLFVPGAVSFFSVYEGTNRGVRQGQRTELDGTLLSQIGVMLPLLEAQAVTLYDKENLTQPSVLKYPQRALREALVNAFAHRDYQRVEPLRVTAFSDRVEINSPGSLPSGIRLEEVRRSEVGAHWRNQTLAWFFNRLGLAEAEGQGIETIHETMRGAGCPPPEFQADEVKVICTLRAHPRAGSEPQSGHSPPKNGGSPPIFAVPFSRNPFFTGREDILESLSRRLAAGGRAALGQAITGLGGIGKTQIVVEFAYRHRNDYRAVFFVRAENEVELVGGFAAIAGQLGLPEAGGQDQLAAALAARRWLESSDGWLLILDNADTPELLTTLLPAGAKGHVLITSRAPSFAKLHVEAQRLAAPPNGEAVAFLLERTGRKNPSAAEHLAATELASELGNLPLALEQAGAYLVARQASFADYLASYRRRGLDLLARPGEFGHHAPVATTWALNFREVQETSPASADLLRAAAFLDSDAIPDEFFLDGGLEISPAMAAAVEGADPLAVVELAAPLLRYSLLERDPEARTLSVHRLVQELVKVGLGNARTEVLERVVKAMRRAFPSPAFHTWPRCERLLPHLVALGKAAHGSPELAWLLNAGALYLYERARYAEAEPLFLRSLAIRERSLGQDHPDVAKTLNNLAQLFANQGQLADAEPLYRRALAIWEKALGADHPDVAHALSNLANLYQDQGRLDEAGPLYRRALDIRKKTLGADHPLFAYSLNGLANHYRMQGQPDEAEPLYRRALAIWEKALGADHPDVAYALQGLAGLYALQGRLDEAEPLLRRALDLREKALGDGHPLVARLMNNLAHFYRKQSRDTEAEALEARAEEVLTRHRERNPISAG